MNPQPLGPRVDALPLQLTYKILQTLMAHGIIISRNFFILSFFFQISVEFNIYYFSCNIEKQNHPSQTLA